MQQEKLAAIGLIVIIIVAIAGFLIITYGGDFFEKKGSEVSGTVTLARDDSIISYQNSANNISEILVNDEYSNRSSLEVQIVSQASNGIVNITADKILYTPNTNFLGTDSFVYKIIDKDNQTSQATVTIQVKLPVIKSGDCADVYYIGKFTNGTVFDTNIENIAIQSGIFNETRKLQGAYNISNVFVDPDFQYSAPPGGYENYSAGFIPGFLKGLIGMEQGETKNITIPPEDGYGIWNTTLAEQLWEYYYGLPYLPRSTPTNFIESRAKSDLTSYYNSSLDVANLTVNQIFDYMDGFSAEGAPLVWQIKVINISGDTVTIQHLVQNGTVLKYEGFWDIVIVYENDTTFLQKNEPVVGGIYGAAYSWMKVLDVNETAVKIALNAESPEVRFIGETLVFQLEAVNVYKTSFLLEG